MLRHLKMLSKHNCIMQTVGASMDDASRMDDTSTMPYLKNEQLPTLGKVSAANLPNTACETSNLQAMYFKRALAG